MANYEISQVEMKLLKQTGFREKLKNLKKVVSRRNRFFVYYDRLQTQNAVFFQNNREEFQKLRRRIESEYLNFVYFSFRDIFFCVFHAFLNFFCR